MALNAKKIFLNSPDSPYGSSTYLTRTLSQGKSPRTPVRYLNLPNPNPGSAPGPSYGSVTYLSRTLTQGANPPDPPYGTSTYLTLTQTLFFIDQGK